MKIIPLYKSSESKLIKKSVRGDRKSQQELFDQFSPKMLSVCRMYIHDLQFAEDIMIKGFFKVFNKLDTFQFNGSFEGWMRRIMVNESINFLRAKKELEFSDQMESDYNLVSDYQEGDYESKYIQDIIDDLPPGYKVVFVMYMIEGYRHKEIGEILGISEGTSKSQLAKARKVLQEKLNLNKYKDGTKRI